MGTPSRQTLLNSAAIILAGGDGTRLCPLTQSITGRAIPKQFCAVTGEYPLLSETIRRVTRLIPAERVIVVVNQAHCHLYEPLLRYLGRRQIVVQPANRGTAPAILYGLRRVLRFGGDPVVTIFPSDHFVGDDQRFMRHVKSAMGAIESHPELSVILGVVPTCAETSYGWIQPAGPISPSEPDLLHVARFCEKPHLDLAQRLWRGGCLWNSFVISARASTLERLTEKQTPNLFASISAAALDGAQEEAAAQALYERLPSVGFSESVLSRCPQSLAVQRVDDVVWSDLGEPDRVLNVLKQMGHRPAWVEPFVRRRAMSHFAMGDQATRDLTV